MEYWPGWAGTLDEPGRSRVVGQVALVSLPGEVRGPAPMLGACLLGVAADSPNAERATDFIRFGSPPKVKSALQSKPVIRRPWPHSTAILTSSRASAGSLRSLPRLKSPNPARG